MEPQKTKSNIPRWVWLMAGLALLMLCAVVATGVLAIGAFSVFTTTAPESDADIVLIEPIESLEADTETAQSPVELPATATASAEVDSQETSEPIVSAETAVPGEAEARETAEGEEMVESKPPDNDIGLVERAAIEANVVNIRELEPLAAVDPTLLSASELGQRLEEEFAESYSPEEARNDAIAWSAFDFFPADFDLYNFVISLYTEQIAGFYDAETDEFVIIGDDDEFDVLEQWTHAHEYVHALQDQHYDLEILDDESLDSEATFALQALAEGDATLVQTLYLLGGYFDQEQLFEILTTAFEIDTAVLDSAPPVIAHELEFPYITGLAFVQALYDEGGFAAVDEAWEQLPQSTEHILHPDRYLANDAPQLVTVAPLTDTLGAGWQLAKEDILGEFYLREYLSQQLDSNQVNEAATGWGGDRYAVYWNESNQQSVLVLQITWDTAADAKEFLSFYPKYPDGLFGVSGSDRPDAGTCWQGADVICLYALGDQSLVIRAPDMNIMNSVTSALIP
jgi:hypothetical protein